MLQKKGPAALLRGKLGHHAKVVGLRPTITALETPLGNNSSVSVRGEHHASILGCVSLSSGLPGHPHPEIWAGSGDSRRLEPPPGGRWL